MSAVDITAHSRVEITVVLTQRTPQGLQSDRVDTPLPHPEADVVESLGSSLGVTALTAPEDLGRGSSTGPDNLVEVVLVGLLGPEEGLSTHDELSLSLGHVGFRVERVGLRD